MLDLKIDPLYQTGLFANFVPKAYTQAANLKLKTGHMEDPGVVNPDCTIKRLGDVEYYGQTISDISVVAFDSGLNCDVRIITSEGHALHAHQVIITFFF